MKKNLLLAICLLGVVLFTVSGSADVIGLYTVDTGGYCTYQYNPVVNLSIDSTNPWPKIFLFNGPDTDPTISFSGIDPFANVGNTFWVRSNADDPEYSQFVSLLKVGNYVDVWLNNSNRTGGVGYFIPYYGFIVDKTKSNFSGYNIDGIGLTIVSATRTTTSDPNLPYITDVVVTCTVEGTSVVPEPSPVLLFAVGILAICGLVIYRRRFAE